MVPPFQDANFSTHLWLSFSGAMRLFLEECARESAISSVIPGMHAARFPASRPVHRKHHQTMASISPSQDSDTLSRSELILEAPHHRHEYTRAQNGDTTEHRNNWIQRWDSKDLAALVYRPFDANRDGEKELRPTHSTVFSLATLFLSKNRRLKASLRTYVSKLFRRSPRRSKALLISIRSHQIHG